MKLQELTDNNFKTSLSKVLKANISGTASWKLAKLTRQLEQELEDYNTTREELLKKFADKNEHGEPIINNGVYQLNDDALKAFAMDHNKLLQQEVKFNNTVKVDELGDLSKIELAAQDFLNLEEIITE